MHIRNATLTKMLITFSFLNIFCQTNFTWKKQHLSIQKLYDHFDFVLKSFWKKELSNLGIKTKVTGILAAYFLHKNRYGLKSKRWQQDRRFSESCQVLRKKIYGNRFHSRTRVRLKPTRVSGAQQPYEFLQVVFNRRQ